MLAVAIGWQVYMLTRSSLALGIVGLVQVLPVIFFSLPAGHLSDHANRKLITLATRAILTLCSVAYGCFAFFHTPVWPIFVFLFLAGMASAYNGPAGSTLIVYTVPEEHFANAATWSSNSWQIASALGPALGGAGIALMHGSTTGIYFADVALSVVVLAMLAAIKGGTEVQQKKSATLQSVLAGIHFLRESPVLLSAITLDMFAVLLGGATALLPVYATKILHVGPVGLGWMRAMPSIGASLMALFIAHRRPFRKAGQAFLWAVAGFGVCTIVFGVSHIYPLSLAMLFIMGALDNISVVVRSTLMLVMAPDEMRGRVSAVNSIFVSSSNELGAFESGLTAWLLGPVLAVAAGGAGTILVVIACALIWPQLRNLGSLQSPHS